MNGFRLILTGLLGLLASSAQGGEGILSLYQDALDSDAQFTAARAQYESVLERVPQSRAALLPAVVLDANTVSNDNHSNTFDHQAYNSRGYTVRLTQPLFRLESKIAYDQTRILVKQAQAQLELARQELILRVSEAYFSVLLAGDSLKALSTEKSAVGEELASAERQLPAGHCQCDRRARCESAL